MNAVPRTRTIAERAGEWLGRAFRRFARQEARAIQWLSSRGLPGGLARLLLWVVKLAVLVVLLYTTFWLALMFLLAFAAASALRRSDLDDENQSEWREGHSGFGLYDQNEWRRDMGDPDEP